MLVPDSSTPAYDPRGPSMLIMWKFSEEETEAEYIARRLAEINAPSRPSPREGTVTKMYHEVLGDQTSVAPAPAPPAAPPSRAAPATPAAPPYRNFSLPFPASATAPAMATRAATSHDQEDSPPFPAATKGLRLQKPKAFLRKVSGALASPFRRGETKAESSAMGAARATVSSGTSSVIPILRRVNEGNNLIGSDKAREITGNGHSVARRPLPGSVIAFGAGSDLDEVGTTTQTSQDGSAQQLAPSSQDPFTSENVMGYGVNSPLPSSPVAESTPRARHRESDRTSPDSPTDRLLAVGTRVGSHGGSLCLASRTRPDDTGQAGKVDETEAERKRKRRAAPPLDELEAMTKDLQLLESHHDQVEEIVKSPPLPGEPTTREERFDWAFAMVKSSLQGHGDETSLMAETGTDVRLGQARGQLRTTRYRPVQEEDPEQDDLDHSKNQI